MNLDNLTTSDRARVRLVLETICKSKDRKNVVFVLNELVRHCYMALLWNKDYQRPERLLAELRKEEEREALA